MDPAPFSAAVQSDRDARCILNPAYARSVGRCDLTARFERNALRTSQTVFNVSPGSNGGDKAD